MQGGMKSSLPNLESRPIIFLRFTTKANEGLVKAVEERLVEDGIIVFREKDSENNILFGVTVKKNHFEKEAERCVLHKPCKVEGLHGALSVFNGSYLMKPFEIVNRTLFRQSHDEGTAYYDSEGIFTSADRVYILYEDLEALPVLKTRNSTSNLVRVLNETLKVPSDDITSVYRDMYLFDTLMNNNFVDVLAPVHHPNISEEIWKETFKFRTPLPIEKINSYYGSEIAFYFEWMNFYNIALLVPGGSGLIIYLLRTFVFHDTVDTCRLTPFHGIITFCWAIVFLQFWIRRENTLSYRWGTSKLESQLDVGSSVFTTRHEFRGKERLSEVTGKREKYYPANMRRLKYVGSALVTICLLGCAFVVMILSLNLQGFIKHHHDHGDPDCEHPFHFPSVAKFAAEGAIFDTQSTYCCYIPVIIHVALVMTMNNLYQVVAKILSDWENHENQLIYENSIIIKRFFFEAIDCYLVILYLAFYEQDVDKVRSELVSVFHVDTIRRILLEGVVPYISQKLSQKKTKKDIGDVKKNEDLVNPQSSNESSLEQDAAKSHYETFDDYIEMIIQFGYITLFASAYPLAPFIAIVANFLEIRLDMFKVTYLSLRPRVVPASGIGMWRTLLSIIAWGSALTNCFIFTFSSMQMLQFMPEFFDVDSEGEHDLKSGSGRFVVFIIFGIERALILVGILLALAIPNIPEKVLIQEKRKNYIEFRSRQEARGLSSTN